METYLATLRLTPACVAMSEALQSGLSLTFLLTKCKVLSEGPGRPGCVDVHSVPSLINCTITLLTVESGIESFSDLFFVN